MSPSRPRAILTGLALVPVLAWTLFPIYWIATASLKTELSLYAKPPEWVFTPVLDNYRRVLTNIPFLQYVTNSLVVAVGTTLGSLVLGIAFSPRNRQRSVRSRAFVGRDGISGRVAWIFSTARRNIMW